MSSSIVKLGRACKGGGLASALILACAPLVKRPEVASAEVRPTRTEPTNFSGRIALVTGAGSGLGNQIARRLVAAGAHVILVDIKEAELEATREELTSSGGSATAVPCDLRDVPGTCSKLEAAGVVGTVDLLVNCAGVAIFKPFSEITQDVWDLTMDINARSMLFLSQLLADGMAIRGGGAIVNISSQSSTVVVSEQHLCYSASKACVDHLTKSTAICLAAKNIRVNAVNPTVVRTELAVRAHGEEGLQKMAAKVPLRRICQPDDVADVVLFLLSDRASMVSGVTLPVDGGFLAARR